MERRHLKFGFALSVAKRTLLAGGLIACSAASAQTLPWANESLPPGTRAELLIQAMTPEQKFEQMVGKPGVVPELPKCFGGRHVPGLLSLKIPTFRITNGPVGVGQNDCVPLDKSNGGPGASLMSRYSAKAVALPSAIALAASFDRNVATQFGDVLGREARDLGLQVIEAPGVNLARMPQGGRNFEYFGEDPYLSGTMAVAEIRAIQAHGVIAMPKHFVANDQETDRMRMNVIVDDRVLHELYLLPFEMAVKEGAAAAIMCSYNTVNGSQMCQNRHLLTDVLRRQWGFKGFVQSDFFATKSLDALQAGLDLEMPGYRLDVPGRRTWFTPENFRTAIKDGKISMSDIDTALTRRYREMFRLGIMDRPVKQSPIDIAGDSAIAAKIGEQGAVLLKNQRATLPFDAGKLRTIALIGNADYADKAVVGGGGSSEVIPFDTVPPLEGMRRTLAALSSHASATLTVVADDNANLAEAVAAAKKADAVVVFAGALSSEGVDRPNLTLPKQQDAMIRAIAAANPHMVVVLNDNAASLLPWIDKVPAVLETWYPGQEDGLIVSRLVLGAADPSGKLPVTFPRTASDLPASTPEQFPGVMKDNMRRVKYSEGLKIGYRWYDAKGIKPLFPFGYGLSYTNFALSEIDVTPHDVDRSGPVLVNFTLQNTGKVAGAQVVQVYLDFPKKAGEPPRRLAGFKKVWLKPGEKQRGTIRIDPSASSHPFGVFDAHAQRWKTMPGSYTVMVGTSSDNIVARRTVKIGGKARP